MTLEWGPWIEHDQNGCPLRDGQIAELYCVPDGADAFTAIVTIGRDYARSDWDLADRAAREARRMGMPKLGIIRYRLPKSRAFTMLEDLAAEPPIEVPA